VGWDGEDGRVGGCRVNMRKRGGNTPRGRRIDQNRERKERKRGGGKKEEESKWGVGGSTSGAGAVNCGIEEQTGVRAVE